MERYILETFLHRHMWSTEVDENYFLKFYDNDTFCKIITRDFGISLSVHEVETRKLIRGYLSIPYECISVEGICLKFDLGDPEDNFAVLY